MECVNKQDTLVVKQDTLNSQRRPFSCQTIHFFVKQDTLLVQTRHFSYKTRHFRQLNKTLLLLNKTLLSRKREEDTFLSGVGSTFGRFPLHGRLMGRGPGGSGNDGQGSHTGSGRPARTSVRAMGSGCPAPRDVGQSDGGRGIEIFDRPRHPTT